MHLNQLAARVTEEFAHIHGQAPHWITAAPGRVNLIGEHTDYNDGFVLPMAIERFAVMAAAPGLLPNIISIHDAHSGDTVQIPVSKTVEKGEPKWSNYLRGVVAAFQQRGEKIPALDIALVSNVPLGGGLSSSAALEVCMATLLETVLGKKLDPVEKALLCQKAEHEFAGVPCGIMDQFISVMACANHLLLLDCRSRQTDFVPMTDTNVELLIINTNVKRELGDGEYAKRRAECEAAAKILGVSSLRDATAEKLAAAKEKMTDVHFRRARHVIGENERTVSAAENVRSSNWPEVGRLMYASHDSLREDYEVSCKELDAVVEIAKSIGEPGGIFGCRMTGGGFGGCCVALVKTDEAPMLSKKIASEYKVRTGINPTIFSTHAAQGATVLKA